MRTISACLCLGVSALLLGGCTARCPAGYTRIDDSCVALDGSVDGGGLDSGSTDSGSLDSGSLDSGSLDSGSLDSGSLDSGSLDSGSLDSGPADAGLDGGSPRPGRPEVGVFAGDCTGTLIGPSWVITAAHCVDFLDTHTPVRPLTFSLSSDGRTWNQAGEVFEVDRTFALGGDQLGATDIALAHLSTSVPASLARPATLATGIPSSGLVTLFGQGCVAWGEGTVGAMRAVELDADDVSSVLCEADSGGPVFVGTRTDDGPLFQVNSARSGLDQFGDVVAHRAEILAIMATWDAHGAEDIAVRRFCAASTGTLHFGDANGDGELDAICHDRSSGLLRVALGENRLIRLSWTSETPFCNGADEELHVADFDGDGRSDVLCRNRVSTLNTIDYATEDGRYEATELWSYEWCASDWQLFVGDFDGDDRADLLCHSPAGLGKWVDFADDSGHFGGTDFTAPLDGEAWCTHAGARLYMGDVDGNGRTDLICHTAGLGTLDIATAVAGGFDWRFSHLHTPRPGTTEYLCAELGSRLEVFDMDADGRSDLVCTHPDGTTWPSLGPDTTGVFRWEEPGEVRGWAGGIRARVVDVAAQPWNLPR